MKTFYRVFTRAGEFFDFPAVIPIMPFIVNARAEGGFTQDGAFVPYGEMRLVMRLEVQQPLTFMPPQGQA